MPTVQREPIPARKAAMALGWSPERVIRGITMRVLEGEQIAGRWFVDPDSLEQFIAAREQGAAGTRPAA